MNKGTIQHSIFGSSRDTDTYQCAKLAKRVALAICDDSDRVFFGTRRPLIYKSLSGNCYLDLFLRSIMLDVLFGQV